ncbi:MAG: FAD-dependent oxidoreductase [Proteobacteria bacterium]|nr:FAD-dependent oxidoreductase [Pseudomonadota bacterium]
MMQKLVIIGGGFAGMWAALVAAREADSAGTPLSITLVAPDDHLTVRPRLYEPFTPAMRAPLRPLFGPLGIELCLAKVSSIDTTACKVDARDANGGAYSLAYDRLVLAAGSVQRALPVPGATEHALDIDTYAGAEALSAHIDRILARPDSPARLTFVVIGGGFSGIEIAAELRHHLRRKGDEAAAKAARIVLVERESAIGPDLGAQPRPHIEAALAACNVDVRLATSVTAIEADAVTLSNGERIACATTIITTGLGAHPLAAGIGAEHDAQGRVVVDSALRVRGTPKVFAAGDIARAQVDDSHVALMSCQHAVPMGKHAGYNAARELLGLPVREYRQPDYVTCLDLGDFGAVFTTGWERSVAQVGAEVKGLKQMVNTQWIYPPTGDRAALLVASDIDAPWPPEV